MFIPEVRSIHDAIKPLVYFNGYVGMGTFRQPDQSATAYFLIKLYTVFITLFNCTMIYVSLYSMRQVVEYNDNSPMMLTMYEVAVYASCCTLVTAPLLVWLRREGMQDCLRHMSILDETFQAVFGARNEYRSQYIRLTYQVIGICLVMSFMTTYDVVASLEIILQMDTRSALTFFSIIHVVHHPILVTLLLNLNFCTSVGYLGKKFRNINDKLLESSEQSDASGAGKKRFVVFQNIGETTLGNGAKYTRAKNGMNDRCCLLRDIRKAHLELCKLSQKINFAFGIQNLLSMGLCFAMITGFLYTIYSCFSWGNFTDLRMKQVISAAAWTVIYIFEIFVLNHSCWSVGNEAGKTGEIIYELLNSKVDKELEREIQEFSVQMLQNPVRFNACGFFTLDYTFVQGVIGSITTYLVILIQMSHISESTVQNSLVYDDTKV